MLRNSWRQLRRIVPPPLADLSPFGAAAHYVPRRGFRDEFEADVPSLEGSGPGSELGLDPSQICDLASKADGIAFAQETSQHWPLIAGVQHSLEWIHATTGCPWWLAISLITVAFRFLIFPVTLIQIKNSVRMSNAMPETEAVKKAFELRLAQGENMEQARMWYVTEIQKIWAKHNSNPVKSMMPLFANGFVFVSFFIALRGLSEVKVPSMCYEGLFWFKDLTMADPYYALPVLNSLIFWLTIELGAADGMQGTDPTTVNRLKNTMRFLAVVFVPITATFPSSLFCYWITSSCFSLVQSTVIKNPHMRKLLKIPPSVLRTKDPLQNPMFGKVVRQVNAEGKELPFKAEVKGMEVQKLWRERMASILKGKDSEAEEAPVVYTSHPRRKQKSTKLRHTKRR